MKYTYIFLLTIGVLAAGIAFAASAPSNVTGVNGSYAQDGKLTVTWSAATDATGIAFYRVYFSRKSILQSNGDWEDFERTQGDVTSYTFVTPPYPGQTMYVSVLAVNKAGVESDGFQVEAKLDPPGQPATASSSAQPTLEGNFSLDIVQPISSTGLVLTFSKDVASSVTVEHFVIVDASGAILAVHKLEVAGRTVRLETDVQQPKKVYVLGLLQNIASTDGSILASSTPQVSFTGFGELPVTSSSSAAATPGPRGTYGPNPSMFPPAATTSSSRSAYSLPVTTTPRPTHVPQSGPGTLAALAVSGGIAGYMRRKKKVAA